MLKILFQRPLFFSLLYFSLSSSSSLSFLSHNNFTELNLSICEGNKINLYVKIELSEETKIIYENMKAKGFDMFDINDPFYQDICTPYKYANNTDITLPDRKNEITK